MFSEQQKQFLKDLIADSQKTLSEEVIEQVNRTVSGLAKRLIGEEIPKAVGIQLNPIAEKFQALDEAKLGSVVKAQFDSLLEQLAQQENATPAAQFQSQIDDLQRQVQAANRLADKERQVREKLSEDARQQKMDDAVLDAIRGKVKPGTERDLLSLMKWENLLIEEQNQFVVEVPDEYGFKSRKPAPDAVDDLISQRWSHYQAGAGTAPTTGQRSNPSAPSLKHLKVENGKLTLDDATLEQAAREGKLDDVIKELSNATRG